MKNNQLTTVEEFMFIYEHDVSTRLLNILKLYSRCLPSSPIEDLTKDVFLCIPNAGKALWKEFVTVLAVMKIEQSEQRIIDDELF